MSLKNNFTEQIIDVVGSMTKQEKMTMSNALFKKSVEVTDITKDHTVLTGVRHGNYIPIINDKPDYESFPFSDANRGVRRRGLFWGRSFFSAEEHTVVKTNS